MSLGQWPVVLTGLWTSRGPDLFGQQLKEHNRCMYTTEAPIRWKENCPWLFGQKDQKVEFVAICNTVTSWKWKYTYSTKPSSGIYRVADKEGVHIKAVGGIYTECTFQSNGCTWTKMEHQQAICWCPVLFRMAGLAVPHACSAAWEGRPSQFQREKSWEWGWVCCISLLIFSEARKGPH